MRPAYFVENRYSHFADMRELYVGSDFDVQSPESRFEETVQQQLVEANGHLQNEEYGLALSGYEKLRALVLKTAHPTLPVTGGRKIDWTRIVAADVLDPLFTASASMLRATPASASAIPATLISPRSLLPESAQKALQVHEATGIDGSEVNRLAILLTRADEAAAAERWQEASGLFEEALQAGGAGGALEGHLRHDLAIVLEKAGRTDEALAAAERSIESFGSNGSDARERFDAFVTLSGLQRRAGKLTEAGETFKRATDVATEGHLFPLVSTAVHFGALAGARTHGAGHATRANGLRGAGRATGLGGLAELGETGADPATSALDVEAAAVEETTSLTARRFLSERRDAKRFSILDGAGNAVSISLEANPVASFRDFYSQLATTLDTELLHGYAGGHTQLVAYLPHLYFFVLPMAMGDCHAAMGDFEQAEEMYVSVLDYPFVNQAVEVVKLWTRLADLYLDWGDHLYRAARNDTTSLGAARAMYERVARADNTLDGNSPLYRDAKLAGLRTRAQAVLAAPDPLALTENPALVSRLLRARAALQQIDAGLNFFGFAADYIPPFSFEYLQTTARYLAQRASHLEQEYIQFKSQAENEQFRREQLDQQAEIARASVELEQRNVAETEAGIGVAQASVNYAETQRQNALAARNDFNAVRWELLEIAELEAWASSVSNDEVKLTTAGLGYTYYNVTSKKRSHVLYDLAARRTRISHDVEANRLQREITSATNYRAVAEAQLQQARARRAVAEQRVAVAQLQQRFAEENRDFMDLREFSARLWYELAREARRLVRRYLDMAIEVAFLMERAYDAETGRDLGRIRFDYGRRGPSDRLGGEALLEDVDSFTVDYVRTRSKKAHIKQTVSIADAYPIAFSQLKRLGRASFETTLEQFDRDYPGFYLHKIKNVELQLVGLTSAEGIHGTLRNIGTSTFRRADGATETLVYPADVMPLSQYEIRQDALAFRFDPNELRLFENNGAATAWQIELPRGTNDFNYDHILDARLVVYYDAFFDPALETTIRAGLPTSGEASRGISMRLFTPDELFYLRSQGSGELEFEPDMFPANHENLRRDRVVLQASGDAPTIASLTLRLASAELGTEARITLDGQGAADSETAGSALAPLLNRPVLDTWTITIDPADNPSLVRDGRLDLTGLRDLSVFLEYRFDYRS
jgi:Tc toxin complex TcA C-terminal TcB-binding domain